YTPAYLSFFANAAERTILLSFLALELLDQLKTTLNAAHRPRHASRCDGCLLRSPSSLFVFMAAANTNLLDVAKCGVCLDLYTDPRFLGCGHTYCQACLDPTLHSIQGKTGKFYQCPECREETKQTKAGLQKNYVIRSMVDQIKTSSGSQGVGKCSGCQKTVVLGELFRCTTCKENSASAADAEIRVCGTCVAKSHKGHDYQELDMASKADFDEVREKIVGYKVANDAQKAVLQMRKDGILAAMLAERSATLTALKDEVDGSGALTKAQLAAKAQQAEESKSRDIAAALVVFGEFGFKLAEIPSLQSASNRTDKREAEPEEQAPVYVIEEITIPASPAPVREPDPSAEHFGIHQRSGGSQGSSISSADDCSHDRRSHSNCA
ncbi:e3 ubiquitin-protein ligase TRIM17-like protein, partial [Aphelenchoides avenae]